eukprot:UN30810
MKPKTKYGGLPYMEVGGKVIAQSDACARWVARKNTKLYPEGKEDAIEEMLGVVGDMFQSFTVPMRMNMRDMHHTVYGHPKDMKKEDRTAMVKGMREGFVKNDLPRFLGYFAKSIADNKGKFLCGDAPTLADCYCYSGLRQFRKGHLDHVPTTVLDSNKEIVAYMEAMDSVPEIKKWYEDR